MTSTTTTPVIAADFTHHAIPLVWRNFFTNDANFHSFYAIEDCNNPIHAIAFGGNSALIQVCANDSVVVTQTVDGSGVKWCHFACTEYLNGFSGFTPPEIDVSQPIDGGDMQACQSCISSQPDDYLVDSFDTSTFNCNGCAVYFADYRDAEKLVLYPDAENWFLSYTCLEELVHMGGTEEACTTTTTSTLPPLPTSNGRFTNSVASALIAFVASTLI